MQRKVPTEPGRAYKCVTELQDLVRTLQAEPHSCTLSEYCHKNNKQCLRIQMRVHLYSQQMVKSHLIVFYFILF